MKTSDEQKTVNRPQGNTKIKEGLNHWITAAKCGPPVRALRILTSGDISITLDDERQAQKLKEDDSWITIFGQGARMAVITYGVIAHGVPTKDLPTKDGELIKDSAIKLIKARNDVYFGPSGLDITWAKWLSKAAARNEKASCILQLSTPEQANRLKKWNLSIGNEMYFCKTYNANCRSSQCHKCWKYGHRQQYCPNHISCPRCANPHGQKDCPEGSRSMCAACGGGHTAFDSKCPEKKKDEDRRVQNRMNTPLEHPVPVKIRQPKIDNDGFQLVDRGREATLRRPESRNPARSKSAHREELGTELNTPELNPTPRHTRVCPLGRGEETMHTELR